MAKSIVNLTEPIVVQEIEEVLSKYPDRPYQRAFAIPDLRQKLIVYVMTRSRVAYAVVESETNVDSRVYCPSIEERLQIEALIHQGVQQIFQEDAEWAIRHLPQKVSSPLAPSNWFG